MIDDARGSIDFEASGSGPTVVLVPGSCSTGAAWRPVIAAWEGRFRCVTTSLLGYGGTAERRTDGDVGMAHETDAIDAVIRQAGGDVHLVGHSFGGLVALTAALRGHARVRSLAIVEAPALELLPAMGEHAFYDAFRAMTQVYFAAFDGGAPDAIATMVDFYGGTGTWASWPQRVRAYAEQTTHVNVRDWATAFGFPLSPALLSAVDIPVTVMTGTSSHPAAQRANELLSRCLPRATFVVVPGAAHFMTATHPKDVAREIAQHIDRAEAC